MTPGPRSAGAAIVLVAALVSGCGGGGDGDRPGAAVRWEGDPRVLSPPTAESDRTLQGVVRNDGPEPVELDATSVELRDAEDRRVPGTAVFLTGYVRPGESQNRGRAELSRQERERLGKVARVDPGATAPLVVSWRTRDGAPVRVVFPGGSLPVPGQ